MHWLLRQLRHLRPSSVRAASKEVTSSVRAPVWNKCARDSNVETEQANCRGIRRLKSGREQLASLLEGDDQ
jgi:hypothetical protein